MTTAPATVDRAPIPSLAFPRHRAARIAGVGYLLIFALAIVANFGVREAMIVPGDAAATTANISESIGTFRLGLVAFLTVFVLDLVVAWALHVVFRDVAPDLSLLAAWLRVVYSVFLGVALVFLFRVRHWSGAPSTCRAWTSGPWRRR